MSNRPAYKSPHYEYGRSSICVTSPEYAQFKAEHPRHKLYRRHANCASSMGGGWAIHIRFSTYGYHLIDRWLAIHRKQILTQLSYGLDGNRLPADCALWDILSGRLTERLMAHCNGFEGGVRSYLKGYINRPQDILNDLYGCDEAQKYRHKDFPDVLPTLRVIRLLHTGEQIVVPKQGYYLSGVQRTLIDFVEEMNKLTDIEREMQNKPPLASRSDDCRHGTERWGSKGASVPNSNALAHQ